MTGTEQAERDEEERQEEQAAAAHHVDDQGDRDSDGYDAHGMTTRSASARVLPEP